MILLSVPIVVLFWCDPSDGNKHYGNDDGKGEPRVLCLDLSDDGYCDDSSVSHLRCRALRRQAQSLSQISSVKLIILQEYVEAMANNYI